LVDKKIIERDLIQDMENFNNTIDLTFDDLSDFLGNYIRYADQEKKILKFFWLEDDLELDGYWVDYIQDNVSSEIEYLSEFLCNDGNFKNKEEVLYDSNSYKLEGLNRIETKKLYVINKTIFFDVSIYDYPDLIKNEDDIVIWDSSKKNFKYKNIIDKIRLARKKYQKKIVSKSKITCLL
jgi:hypothetical protein